LDEHEHTALHLVTSADYGDPATALAILREVPEAATIHVGCCVCVKKVYRWILFSVHDNYAVRCMDSSPPHDAC
jgi:hypothetical protein